ncbi:Inactive leucine-rich repeat receptor-like protein kinase [Melia azedarach]|uniref:Inactive leucine-rich repeat receptor-like protein kinase n=1 Tax=Melia azedarach TaxID=155640 RepID=A0ACC1YJF3_MELAZ|nr:Inactive leucine-rich repeat receptor-like protein kinase [Melia azedarach]
MAISLLENASLLMLIFHSLYCISVSNSICYAIELEADVLCLKTIKSSVRDPFGHLNSWKFDNTSEYSICPFFGIECWTSGENRVKSIHLGGMRLQGQFPQGIENCRSLTELDLSGNNFSGPIPPNIGGIIPFLTYLDLSVNNFSGEIPPSLANCMYLNFLILDNNKLQGQIPPQLAQLYRLKTLNVSNNLLSGQIPEFFSLSLSSDDCTGNLGLCGAPLEPCKKHGKKSNFPVKFDVWIISGFAVGYVLSTVLAFGLCLYTHF